MKKLIILSAIALLGSIGISNAQIQEGNFMVGSDFGSGLINTGNSSILGLNFGLNDGAGYNLGLSPKLGYFVKDNFMLGAVANIGFSKSAESEGSTETTVYGFQALSRYYLSPGEKGIDNLLSHGRFFVEANAGIAGVNVAGGNTTNGFAFGVGPGYSYFLTDNVALETNLKYNGLVGGGNTTYQNSLGLNFGIQVFIPSSRAKELRDNPEMR
ncbi:MULTISPECIES: hypothetical protein [unclassified Zunongwangia]|uniref:hypothetical protein n=1 Tax=unclassified Zunongwangia TaxID=2632541 RepID=UPI0022DD1026|nr:MULTISPECIES: hypothetical protein [unclassified Zunongwangia]WBL23018.1 hypothetical protein PBT89_03440 [Zunongwangia sp. HRR-M8]WBL25021.1 hypothetical protein PBT91_14095 [Zunongwangia sp. HGR-M22]